jgi:hypothetical protein
MFIGNFQGTYELLGHLCSSGSIYVKRFYNARNSIPYIQDIKIINAF